MRVCVSEEQEFCVTLVLKFYFLVFNSTFSFKLLPISQASEIGESYPSSRKRRSNGEVKENLFVDVRVMSTFRRVCVCCLGSSKRLCNVVQVVGNCLAAGRR